MSRKLRFVIAFVFFAFPTHRLGAKGIEVILHLKNGQQMRSELYSVTDSSLVIKRREAGTEHLSEVSTKEIQQVIIKNNLKVVLLLKNGLQMTGKLYAVSDSSVTIYSRYAAEQNGGPANKEFMAEVRNQDIQKLVIKGKFQVFKDMGKGLLIAGGFGAIVGYASGDDEDGFMSFSAEAKAAIFGSVFGGVGLLVGGIHGIETSTRTKEMTLSDHQPYSVLKPLARDQKRAPKN